MPRAPRRSRHRHRRTPPAHCLDPTPHFARLPRRTPPSPHVSARPSPPRRPVASIRHRRPGVRMIDLEEILSRPTDADVECLRRVPGNIAILGAGGKMGPSLARLCRRAADAGGPPRSIYAVSRRTIDVPGVHSIACDLLDHCAVGALPNARNVFYLAGRKFGSAGNPELTWAMNTVVPAIVAERFARARIVVFSTGNLYPLREPATGGSRETDPPAPVGEYAQSCLGRERVFEHFSARNETRCLLFRLN